ncbi:MAG: hypothetical protein LBH66_06850 [Oscillospiraceae bacterium]|nr:hypothetical protein [Oscillospiraceae bacterium]
MRGGLDAILAAILAVCVLVLLCPTRAARADSYAAVVDTADKSGAAPLYSRESTSSTVIARYRNGARATMLGVIHNGGQIFAYIEGSDVNGRLFRGFAPYSVVSPAAN